MIVQFVAIGNEILSGKIMDLNLPWLAKFLAGHGLQISRGIIARDDRQELTHVLRQAWQESQVVITSGGLGPTLDDLTKEAAGSMLDLPLEYSEESYRLCCEHYQRRQLSPPSPQHTYAFLPRDFIPIGNPCGLAPGLCYWDPGQKKLLLCAPGVPREFQEMVEKEFTPHLKRPFPGLSPWQKHLTIRTRSIPEEKIFSQLDTSLWADLSQWGQVSSLPHVTGVDIGVFLQARSPDELQEKWQKALQRMQQSPVAAFIWHIGDETLPQLIVQLAREKQITFSFAESCTGGLLSSLITDIPGSSKVFRGSVISYQTEVKEKVLQVPEGVLSQEGVVSEATARQMATGARELLQTQVAVATTGWAGPAGGDERNPVGTLCLGLATQQGSRSATRSFQGDRKRLKDIFAHQALHFLLDELKNGPREQGF